jgi:hypothetical protein
MRVAAATLVHWAFGGAQAIGATANLPAAVSRHLNE